ncbi:hypothetical protein Clacol_010225 [Clathrus columnatus]|uniref:C2H2-type domain-containing protein n=1 Tax=Clathrus columnatus TaxID=1419009 RepID=A0AAV5AMS2_9AGAM|nr:hypothetical protein Clacol_010225 [Clathrus columnatus]
MTSTNLPSRLLGPVRPSSSLRPNSNQEPTEQNNANNAFKYVRNSIALSGVGPDENALSQRPLDTSSLSSSASPWPHASNSGVGHVPGSRLDVFSARYLQRDVSNSSAAAQHSRLQNFNVDMANRVGEPTSQKLWPGPSTLNGTSNSHNFTNPQAPGYNPTFSSQYPGGTNNSQRRVDSGSHRNIEDQRNGYSGSTMLNMNHQAQIASQPMHPFHTQRNSSMMATARVSDVAAQPSFQPQTGMNNPRGTDRGPSVPSSFNGTNQTTQAPHPTRWLNPQEVPVGLRQSSTGRPNPSRVETFQNVANDNNGHITANLGNNARTAFGSQPRVEGPREIPHSNPAMFPGPPGMTGSNGMPMPQPIPAPPRFSSNPLAVTSRSDKHETSCRVVRPRKRRGRPLKSVRPSSPHLPTPTLTSPLPDDLQKTSPFLLCKDGTFSCQYRGAAAGPFGCGVMGIIGEENKDCHMSVHAFGEEQMLQERLLNPNRIWALLWTRKIRQTCPEPGCGFSEVAWRMERVLERHHKEQHTDGANATDSDSEESEDEDEDEEWE